MGARVAPISGFNFFHYRPHPEDGGRYCFQFVCQSTFRGGGVTPVRSRGIPHPRSSRGGGYPIPGLGGGKGGTPSQARMGNPLTWDGVPPQKWDGVPPRPGMG